jgi:hypothetical protein
VSTLSYPAHGSTGWDTPLKDYIDAGDGLVSVGPSSTPGANLTAAIAALGAAGGTAIIPPGTWVWESVPALPKNITGQLRIIGAPGARIQLTTAAPRFLDFNRTADYDTFQNIEISDLLIDCNNILSTSHNHVLIGTEALGGILRRVNLDRITVRRCRTINVPLSDTQVRSSVFLCSGHLASGETQTTITNITVQDCDFQGGHVGVAVMGSLSPGGSVTAGQGVNVYIDNVLVENVRHDSGVVPTGSNTIGANFQIGGVGHCGTVRLNNCHGYNSSDVNLEVDAAQDFVAHECEFVDGWNVKALVRNFRPPVSVNAQKNTLDSCYFRNLNLDRASKASPDFYINGDATAGYEFGELAAINCHNSDEKTTAPSTTLANNIGTGGSTPAKFRKLTIRGYDITYTALAVASGGNTFLLCDVRSGRGDAVYDIQGLSFYLSGARSGGGAINTWKLTQFGGTTPHLFVRDLSVDGPGLSGTSTTLDQFHWVGLAQNAASTMTVSIDGVHALSDHPGKNYPVWLDANLTIAGSANHRSRGVITRLNTTKLSEAAGLDVNFGASAQKDKTVVDNTLNQRSPASGLITVPTAIPSLTTNTAITLGATVPGRRCVVVFTPGSGTGITSVDYSTNAGTTYVNLLTQGAAALPAGLPIVVGPLPPHCTIKATFAAGTTPTGFFVPVP